jgi:hypothetical protein
MEVTHAIKWSAEPDAGTRWSRPTWALVRLTAAVFIVSSWGGSVAAQSPPAGCMAIVCVDGQGNESPGSACWGGNCQIVICEIDGVLETQPGGTFCLN